MSRLNYNQKDIASQNTSNHVTSHGQLKKSFSVALRQVLTGFRFLLYYI